MGAEHSTYKLPDELLVKILSLLSARDVASAARVSRHLCSVAATDMLWRPLVSQDFTACREAPPATYHEFYRYLADRYKPGRRALRGQFFAFRGQWHGDGGQRGYSFAFELVMEPFAGRFSERPDDREATVDVRGHLSWTLTAVPGDWSFLAVRLGHHAKELVVGIYDTTSRRLTFSGYTKQENQINGTGLIDCDEYRITLAHDGLSFAGVTRGYRFDWDNKIAGRYDQELDFNGQAMWRDDPLPLYSPRFDFLRRSHN